MVIWDIMEGDMMTFGYDDAIRGQDNIEVWRYCRRGDDNIGYCCLSIVRVTLHGDGRGGVFY